MAGRTREQELRRIELEIRDVQGLLAGDRESKLYKEFTVKLKELQGERRAHIYHHFYNEVFGGLSGDHVPQHSEVVKQRIPDLLMTDEIRTLNVYGRYGDEGP